MKTNCYVIALAQGFSRNGSVSTLSEDILKRALQIVLEEKGTLFLVGGNLRKDWGHYYPSGLQSEAKAQLDYVREELKVHPPFAVESESRNTRENLLFTREMIRSSGLDNKELVVVTHAGQMPRVRALARRLNIKIIPVAVPSRFGRENIPWYLTSAVRFYFRESLVWVHHFLRRWI